MVRALKKNRYIVAAVLTLSIFLLGLMLGLIIEEKRLESITNFGYEQKLDLESLQLQYAMLNVFSQEDNCKALEGSLQEYLKLLEETRIKLVKYSQNSVVYRENFDILKREYFLAEIKYWTLIKELRKSCDIDVVTVLNFYGGKKGCGDCDKESTVLTYLKDNLKEKFLVFTFTANPGEEKLVDMLKKSYGVKIYPTMVIEGDVVEGFVSKKDLLGLICKKYEEKPEICK